MTLAEAAEVFAYWEQNPPAHLLLQAIARLLGWTPAGVGTAASVAAPPPGLAVAHRGLGMPAPLDAEALRVRNRTRAMEIAMRTTADTRGRAAPASNSR